MALLLVPAMRPIMRLYRVISGRIMFVPINIEIAFKGNLSAAPLIRNDGPPRHRHSPSRVISFLIQILQVMEGLSIDGVVRFYRY